MKWLPCFCLCCFGIFDLPSSTLAGDTGRFRDDVAVLFTQQDRSATGRADALAQQKSMFSSINKMYGDAEKFDATESNLHAMTEYVLSGGNPELAERFLERGGLPEKGAGILLGAIHFMRGERDHATKLLTGIDPLRLPPGLVGRIALVQAMLLADDDHRKLELLDIAIAAMPGTLVEESALRRWVAAASVADAAPHFWSRAARYLRRFSRSFYGVEFSGSLIGTIVSFEKRGQKVDQREIELLFYELPANRRRAAYLSLARTSFADGFAGLVMFASRRASRLSLEGSQEKSSSILYANLYGIAGEAADFSIGQLETVDASILGRRERLLLEAARSIAWRIRSPMTELLDEHNPAAKFDRGSPELNTMESSVDAALVAANRLLRDAMQ